MTKDQAVQQAVERLGATTREQFVVRRGDIYDVCSSGEKKRGWRLAHIVSPGNVQNYRTPATTGQVIDITPESLKTPEGAARVAATLKAWEDSTAEVANQAGQFTKKWDWSLGSDKPSRARAEADEFDADLADLKTAITEREVRQNAFLATLAGRPQQK